MDLEMADIARNAAEATAYILVTAYTMEQMDRYLWLLGKEKFPRKYYK